MRSQLARGAAIAIAAAALTPAAPASAAVTVIGPGGHPGLTVDAEGTAYLAWNGPGGDPLPLMFCRLPRGATTCAGGPKTIATSGTTVDRPFVVVTGARVVIVQQRYGGDIPGFRALVAHTSTNGGDTFGPTQVIGKHVAFEATPGPGDTISVVTYSGGWFQNAPIDGSAQVDSNGISTTGDAQLFADEWHYNGSVALLDPATPMAMFTRNSGEGLRYRRYSGSGPLNDAASWTPPVQLSTNINSFKLVDGPGGVFLIVVQQDGTVTSRKWIGTEFDERVLIAPNGAWPTLHASQDAGGRLHVTFQTSGRIIHATSDDGKTWRSGTVHTFTTLEEGDLGSPRIAAAPDHIGVVAWNGGRPGSGDIRVAPIGPHAPVDPAPNPAPSPAPTPTPVPAAKPAGRLSVTGQARRSRRRVAVSLTLKLVLPNGVSKAQGCSGNVSVTFKKAKRTLGRRSGTINPATCVAKLRTSLKRSAVGTARSLGLVVQFGGSSVLAPSVQNRGKLRIR